MIEFDKFTMGKEMLAKINEIFESIQGEGILVGLKQIFVRFVGCNLNCNYCDTNTNNNFMELSEEELFDKIKKMTSTSISFTGGEPLLHVDFIKSFLTKYKKFLNKEVYLETNGTLYENLSEIIDLIDVVAMDIKIESATGEVNNFELNQKFLEIAKNKVFIKVVFDKNITEEEIEHILYLATTSNAELILQPKTPIDDDINLLEIYNKFYNTYQDTRLIPQVHKFLGVI